VSLDVAILGFLAERPRSGYDLKTRCFTGPIASFWTADQAQIYRTLERLRTAGLVSMTRRRQSSRPDRRVFQLTSAGRDHLDDRLNSPQPLPPLRDPFLIRLYFSGRVDDESLLDVLTTRRAEHQARLEELRAQAASLAQEPEISPRDAVLKHTALDGAIVAQRAAIDWLDECIDAVQEGTLPGSARGTGQRHLFGT
jgi:DNA-binding PadR family transcriptional regulator